MELFDALLPHLHAKTTIISLVGAGGKTTALYALARSAAARDMKVLVTTTTMLIDPRLDPAAVWDSFYSGKVEDFPGNPEMRQAGRICFAASEPVQGYPKVRGFSGEEITILAEGFDLILVEADGAKHRPVKAPGPHEPVVPASTSLLVGVIGLDCLGKPMDDRTVHRPEHFSALSGPGWKQPIEPGHLAPLIENPGGLFKNAPDAAVKVLLFNKSDLSQEKERMTSFLRRLPLKTPDLILFASMEARDSQNQAELF
jgi:probable selenium-dependent hydroxylase accessory protein YqeC